MELLLRFADLALHEVDDLFRLGHAVVFGNSTDDGVASIEQDDRWRDAFTLGVRDDLGFPVGVDMRDGGEGRSQIDSDCFAIAHVLVKAP